MFIQDNFNTLLAGGFILLCLLPLIIALVAGFFLLRAGRKAYGEIASPDSAQLERRLADLRAANPHASAEQLINREISRQAFRAGAVGAITGLGGLITLPVALPIDIYASLRIQSALVSFIARAYGHTQVSQIESQVRTYLIMSGSAKLSDTAVAVIMKFLLRVIGKSFSKLIPFIGAVVSFAVNYAIVQAVGRAAVKWYSRRVT